MYLRKWSFLGEYEQVRARECFLGDDWWIREGEVARPASYEILIFWVLKGEKINNRAQLRVRV
jgi:hypothetical protein